MLVNEPRAAVCCSAPFLLLVLLAGFRWELCEMSNLSTFLCPSVCTLVYTLLLAGRPNRPVTVEREALAWTPHCCVIHAYIYRMNYYNTNNNCALPHL